MSKSKDVTMYYEAYLKSKETGWQWKIYHYDETGEEEIVKHRSQESYAIREWALDACSEYLDQNDIDAVLA